MFEQARIAVVVPAFNESHFIGETLDTMPTFVDHIIVVDDASRDNTLEIVQSHPQAHRITALSHAHNRGVGAAIVTGYRKALTLGADIVAVMAGDGQMHPDDLSALLWPLVRGEADYAKGNRIAHPDARRVMPRARWAGTQMLAYLTKKAAGLPSLSDSQCGFSAAGADALRAVNLEDLWPRYGYPNDFIGALCRAGMRVCDVPVRPVYRGEKSGLRAWHLFSIGYLIARIAYRRMDDQFNHYAPK